MQNTIDHHPTLGVIDGAAVDRRATLGHAVLNLATLERRTRQVIGTAVEEFHDTLWFNQPHGRSQALVAQDDPPPPSVPDQPA